MANCCPNVNQCCGSTSWGGSGKYAFILVLFILLVICGAAFWY